MKKFFESFVKFVIYSFIFLSLMSGGSYIGYKIGWNKAITYSNVRVTINQPEIYHDYDTILIAKELLIALNKKEVLTSQDINFILEQASSSGGVLVNGWNPLVLWVYLMDKLYKLDYISLDEGYCILDIADNKLSDIE